MSRITINDHSNGVVPVVTSREMTAEEQADYDAFNARISGDNDPRKKLADAITKRETDKAAGIEKLKGLGLTADEAAAVSSN